MKLPFHWRLVLLLAWILRAIRMIGESDYEHFKFHLWFEADMKAQARSLVNVTKYDDAGEVSHREIVGQLEELQEAAR